MNEKAVKLVTVTGKVPVPENSDIAVLDGGVLSVTTRGHANDGTTVRLYSPAYWHHVEYTKPKPASPAYG